MRNQLATCLVLSTSLLASTASAQNTRQVWKDIIANCAASDMLSDDILYTGPTNTLGLGTIWRKANGGYRPVRDFQKIADKATQDRVFHIDTASTCKGDETKSRKFSPSLVFQALLSPLGVNISADLQKGRTASGSVTGWAWDSLLEGEFNDVLQSLPKGYKDDIKQRLVAGRVLRVTGLKADIEYTGNNAAAISAKYKNTVVDVGGGFKAEWKNNNTLHVEAPQSTTYVAIELWKYNENGFQGTTKHFAKEPLPAGSKAIVTEPNKGAR